MTYSSVPLPPSGGPERQFPETKKARYEHGTGHLPRAGGTEREVSIQEAKPGELAPPSEMRKSQIPPRPVNPAPLLPIATAEIGEEVLGKSTSDLQSLLQTLQVDRKACEAGQRSLGVGQKLETTLQKMDENIRKIQIRIVLNLAKEVEKGAGLTVTRGGLATVSTLTDPSKDVEVMKGFLRLISSIPGPIHSDNQEILCKAMKDVLSSSWGKQVLGHAGTTLQQDMYDVVAYLSYPVRNLDTFKGWISALSDQGLRLLFHAMQKRLDISQTVLSLGNEEISSNVKLLRVFFEAMKSRQGFQSEVQEIQDSISLIRHEVLLRREAELRERAAEGPASTAQPRRVSQKEESGKAPELRDEISVLYDLAQEIKTGEKKIRETDGRFVAVDRERGISKHRLQFIGRGTGYISTSRDSALHFLSKLQGIILQSQGKLDPESLANIQKVQTILIDLSLSSWFKGVCQHYPEVGRAFLIVAKATLLDEETWITLSRNLDGTPIASDINATANSMILLKQEQRQRLEEFEKGFEAFSRNVARSGNCNRAYIRYQEINEIVRATRAETSSHTLPDNENVRLLAIRDKYKKLYEEMVGGTIEAISDLLKVDISELDSPNQLYSIRQSIKELQSQHHEEPFATQIAELSQQCEAKCIELANQCLETLRTSDDKELVEKARREFLTSFRDLSPEARKAVLDSKEKAAQVCLIASTLPEPIGVEDTEVLCSIFDDILSRFDLEDKKTVILDSLRKLYPTLKDLKDLSSLLSGNEKVQSLLTTLRTSYAVQVVARLTKMKEEEVESSFGSFMEGISPSEISMMGDREIEEWTLSAEAISDERLRTTVLAQIDKAKTLKTEAMSRMTAEQISSIADQLKDRNKKLVINDRGEIVVVQRSLGIGRVGYSEVAEKSVISLLKQMQALSQSDQGAIESLRLSLYSISSDEWVQAVLERSETARAAFLEAALAILPSPIRNPTRFTDLQQKFPEHTKTGDAIEQCLKTQISDQEEKLRNDLAALTAGTRPCTRADFDSLDSEIQKLSGNLLVKKEGLENIQKSLQALRKQFASDLIATMTGKTRKIVEQSFDRSLVEIDVTKISWDRSKISDFEFAVQQIADAGMKEQALKKVEEARRWFAVQHTAGITGQRAEAIQETFGNFLEGIDVSEIREWDWNKISDFEFAAKQISDSEKKKKVLQSIDLARKSKALLCAMSSSERRTEPAPETDPLSTEHNMVYDFSSGMTVRIAPYFKNRVELFATLDLVAETVQKDQVQDFADFVAKLISEQTNLPESSVQLEDINAKIESIKAKLEKKQAGSSQVMSHAQAAPREVPTLTIRDARVDYHLQDPKVVARELNEILSVDVLQTNLLEFSLTPELEQAIPQYVNRLRQLENLVAHDIASCKTKEELQNRIRFWVQVAEECKELGALEICPTICSVLPDTFIAKSMEDIQPQFSDLRIIVGEKLEEMRQERRTKQKPVISPLNQIKGKLILFEEKKAPGHTVADRHEADFSDITRERERLASSHQKVEITTSILDEMAKASRMTKADQNLALCRIIPSKYMFTSIKDVVIKLGTQGTRGLAITEECKAAIDLEDPSVEVDTSGMLARTTEEGPKGMALVLNYLQKIAKAPTGQFKIQSVHDLLQKLKRTMAFLQKLESETQRLSKQLRSANPAERELALKALVEMSRNELPDADKLLTSEEAVRKLITDIKAWKDNVVKTLLEASGLMEQTNKDQIQEEVDSLGLDPVLKQEVGLAVDGHPIRYLKKMYAEKVTQPVRNLLQQLKDPTTRDATLLEIVKMSKLLTPKTREQLKAEIDRMSLDEATTQEAKLALDPLQYSMALVAKLKETSGSEREKVLKTLKLVTQELLETDRKKVYKQIEKEDFSDIVKIMKQIS